MPVLRMIDDPADPAVAAYTAIRERDRRRDDGSFVAEGRVVLDVLTTSGDFRVDSILVLDRKLESIRPLLERLPGGTPVNIVTQAVLDAVAGFHIHRGILAIGRRARAMDAGAVLAALPASATLVLAFGIANHDNVGGILRNAAAFNADAVLFDAASCDPLYRKAIRVSVGAAFAVPFAHGGAQEAILDAVIAAGFEIWALSPSGEAQLHALPRPSRLALAVGAEGPGLAESVLARARAVRIAMSGRMDSLNVAAATAVALHHAAVAPRMDTGSTGAARRS